MMKKLSDRGYRTMAWPKEYGGRGASFFDQFIFNEAQGYFNAQENEGWESTRATMNFERSGVGFYAMNRHLFERLLAYVKVTRRGSRYLYEIPSVRQKLAEIYGDIEAGYSLAYKVTWLQQQNWRC